MSQADIADAKAVLRSDAIRATFAQTATSMVRGAMVAVVVDGALACLECGLDYAEGKITWREMVQMVVRSGVIAGGGGVHHDWPDCRYLPALPFPDPHLNTCAVCASGHISGLPWSEGCQISQGVDGRLG